MQDHQLIEAIQRKYDMSCRNISRYLELSGLREKCSRQHVGHWKAPDPSRRRPITLAARTILENLLERPNDERVHQSKLKPGRQRRSSSAATIAKSRTEFATRIEQFRHAYGLSRADLANEIRNISGQPVSPANIWQWETGLSTPVIDQFHSVCELFDAYAWGSKELRKLAANLSTSGDRWDLLLNLLRKHHMTQERAARELSKITGTKVSRVQISQWLNRKVRPRRETIEAIESLRNQLAFKSCDTYDP
jgi:transcriptional regulator with XRE-family HTH domain